MAIRLKQSTASQEVPLGPFLDSTDGVTAETALTIANTDIKLWKTGATTLANKNSGGATHISQGVYYAVLDATDTATLGPMVAFISMTGALPIRVEFEVLAANVYDSLIGGGDLLQVDTTEWKGATAPAMTGDAFARLGAPAGASVSADVAALQTGVDALPTNAELATALGTADDAVLSAIAGLTIPTATENADALLARDIGSGTGAGSLNERTVRSALRFLRNKWGVSGTTLTVTKEDDATTAWTGTVTASPGADPISGNDPT